MQRALWGGFSFVGRRIIATLLRKCVLQQNNKRPKSQGQTRFLKETPKLLNLRERS
ncbi:hypothetical protein HPSJM_07275 [Helicobacter pylori SJM180]|nr:hypothetical protein HPSJM_07275 [Helicobacter pylori SJM180]